MTNLTLTCSVTPGEDPLLVSTDTMFKGTLMVYSKGKSVNLRFFDRAQVEKLRGLLDEFLKEDEVPPHPDNSKVPAEKPPLLAEFGTGRRGLYSAEGCDRAAELIGPRISWHETAEGFTPWCRIYRRLKEFAGRTHLTGPICGGIKVVGGLQAFAGIKAFGTGVAGRRYVAACLEAARELDKGLRWADTAEGWDFWNALPGRLTQLGRGE